MTGSRALRLAAGLGLLGVALGAFGAHGLKDVLVRHATVGLWEKAVFYHLIHTLMLYVLAGRTPMATGSWWCFLAGIIFFSGSLYVLALTNLRWLGAITPIGGVCFIAGWVCLTICPSAGKTREPEPSP
jgi:uncharacterized membrane protein YgdD (TMEM256/DUF423 family)